MKDIEEIVAEEIITFWQKNKEEDAFKRNSEMFWFKNTNLFFKNVRFFSGCFPILGTYTFLNIPWYLLIRYLPIIDTYLLGIYLYFRYLPDHR